MSLEEVQEKLAKTENELKHSRSNCEKAAVFGQQLLGENSRLKEQLASANEIVAKERKRCQDLLAETVDVEERCERDFAEQKNILAAEKEGLKKQLIAKQTEATSLRSQNEEFQNKLEQKDDEIKSLREKIQEAQKATTKTGIIEEEEYKKKIAAIEEKVVEYETQARSMMSSLELARKKMDEDEKQAKELTEQNQQLVVSNDEKSETIDKLQERVNDLEFEVQELKAAASSSQNAPEALGQGNSLFNEVEDQRQLTAQKLRDLEENYKGKIENFDALEKKVKELTRFKITAEKELRTKCFTEASNKRLLEENRELTVARNLAVEQAEYYKGLKKATEDENASDPSQHRVRLNQKEAEIRNLNSRIHTIMLDKIGLSDKIKDLNNQLKFLEEKNSNLELRLSKKSISDAEESPQKPLPTQKPIQKEIKVENIQKEPEIKAERKFSSAESEKAFKENAAVDEKLEEIADNFSRDCKQQ